MDIETARSILSVLEYYRQATGVDEWDEADQRTLLYREAWEVLGEDEATDVVGESGTDHRLEHREDVIYEVLALCRAQGARSEVVDGVARRLAATLRRSA